MKRRKAEKFINIRAFLYFEVLYKLAALLFFLAFFGGASTLVMKLNRQYYLTQENIFSFLLHPLFLAVDGIGMAAGISYFVLDVSTVLFVLDQSAQRRKVSSGQIFHFGWNNLLRIIRGKNLLIIPGILFLCPFLTCGFFVVAGLTVNIPGPLLDFLDRESDLVQKILLGCMVLTFLGMSQLYTFTCFTLQSCNAREAFRENAAMGMGKRIRECLQLVLLQAFLIGFFFLFQFLLITSAGFLGRAAAGWTKLDWIASFVVWIAAAMGLFLIAAAAVPAGYGFVGIFYLRRVYASSRTIPDLPVPEAFHCSSNPKRDRVAKMIGSAGILVGSAVVFILIFNGTINPEAEYLHTPEITAHRGASALYPENTMSAFTAAKELGADWIELDIQQSRDGQLVVAHDANLRRVTGVNANIWNLAYEEIAALPVRNTAGREKVSEHIPLLEEVLAFARESLIKLNIELKPTGHEEDLEKHVVEAIQEAGLEAECVVTSQVYSSLEKVKQYDESITTVYVTSLAFGNINQLSASDHFSVEAMSITQPLLSRAHNAGKQVYAWTVNTRRSMMKMIEMGVDNIITDNVDLAKQCVYESHYSDLVEEYVDLVGE